MKFHRHTVSSHRHDYYVVGHATVHMVVESKDPKKLELTATDLALNGHEVIDVPVAPGSAAPASAAVGPEVATETAALSGAKVSKSKAKKKKARK